MEKVEPESENPFAGHALTPAQQRSLERVGPSSALVIPTTMGQANTSVAVFSPAPLETINFDFGHLSEEKREFALEIAAKIVPEMWRLMHNEMNRTVIPLLNNTSEWVNHSTIDGEDILSCYKDLAINSIDNEPSHEEEDIPANVLGDGLVRFAL